MELLPSAHMGSRGTLADWRPSVGLVWPELHLWLCETAMLRLCSLQIGRRGAGERQEEPAVCFTFVLPPEISSEQRVLKLEMSL